MLRVNTIRLATIGRHFCAKAASQSVFFDVSVHDKPVGRLVMKLRDDVAPKTAKNFRSLCTGEAGKNKSGQLLHYENSVLHRIIPGFMAQGGDITMGDGRGGASIYGRTFPDEPFTLKHTKRGQLSMANAGPNTNGSQFFITFAPAPWLDGKHVVFGEVTEGMSVLDAIERCGTQSGRPNAKVSISNCGVVQEE